MHNLYTLFTNFLHHLFRYFLISLSCVTSFLYLFILFTLFNTIILCTRAQNVFFLFCLFLLFSYGLFVFPPHPSLFLVLVPSYFTLPLLILSPAFPPYSRKVARSESARVDRQSSRRRGSSRAKQFRSRSDVDLQPLAATTTTTPTLLSPQHPHP